MADFWTERKQFEKSGDFRLVDWTEITLVLDIQNSIGEKYHFEIEPNPTFIPTSRSSDDPDGNVILNISIINGEVRHAKKKKYKSIKHVR